MMARKGVTSAPARHPRQTTRRSRKHAEDIDHGEKPCDRDRAPVGREDRVHNAQRQGAHKRARHPDPGPGDQQHDDVGRDGPEQPEHHRAGCADEEHSSHPVPVAQHAGPQHRGGQGQGGQRRHDDGHAVGQLQAGANEGDVRREDSQITQDDGATQAHGQRCHNGS